MKKFYTSLIICALFVIVNVINPKNSSSQVSNWQPLRNITSRYNDRNPQFGKFDHFYWNLYSWEFLVFERVLNTSTRQVCVIKIGLSGVIDSVTYITNNLSVNRNPSISYDKNFVITKSLILWETNKNGRWDIYGCYYDANKGWGNPFSIDTSSTHNKSTPKSVFLNNRNFAVVYEKNNDIIFRHVNAQTHIVTYDTNLTINDTAICTNPFISNTPFSPSRYFVSYERKKLNGESGISFRVSNVLPNWNLADTLAFKSNNINYGFVLSNVGNISNIFSSNREGNYNIYETSISGPNNILNQRAVIINRNSDNRNFISFHYPVITENMNPAVASVIGYHAATYLKIGPDSTKVKFLNSFFSSFSDSTTIGDPSINSTLTMNRGLRLGFNSRVWVVFNKDSLGYSNLYGRYSDVVISGIKKIDSQIPLYFSLYQNYPNPFNPTTTIRFDISQDTRGETQDVKLVIYNSLGKEVSALINEKLAPGSYEVDWNAMNPASGAYFYSLYIDSKLIQTKKMMLLR